MSRRAVELESERASKWANAVHPKLSANRERRVLASAVIYGIRASIRVDATKSGHRVALNCFTSTQKQASQ